jgi:hypothetical protein
MSELSATVTKSVKSLISSESEASTWTATSKIVSKSNDVVSAKVTISAKLERSTGESSRATPKSMICS